MTIWTRPILQPILESGDFVLQGGSVLQAKQGDDDPDRETHFEAGI